MISIGRMVAGGAGDTRRRATPQARRPGTVAGGSRRPATAPPASRGGPRTGSPPRSPPRGPRRSARTPASRAHSTAASMSADATPPRCAGRCKAPVMLAVPDPGRSSRRRPRTGRCAGTPRGAPVVLGHERGRRLVLQPTALELERGAAKRRNTGDARGAGGAPRGGRGRRGASAGRRGGPRTRRGRPGVDGREVAHEIHDVVAEPQPAERGERRRVVREDGHHVLDAGLADPALGERRVPPLASIDATDPASAGAACPMSGVYAHRPPWPSMSVAAWNPTARRRRGAAVPVAPLREPRDRAADRVEGRLQRRPGAARARSAGRRLTPAATSAAPPARRRRGSTRRSAWRQDAAEGRRG